MTEAAAAPEVQRVPVGTTVAVAFAYPMACLATVVAAFASWSDRLPDELASHWGGSGADGSMSRAAFFSLTVGLGALLATAGLLIALASVHFSAQRAVMSIAATSATYLAGLAVSALWANLDVASWVQARNIGGWSVVAVLVASAVAGTCAWLVAGRPTPTPPEQSPWSAPARRDRRRERLWSGRAQLRWPLYLSAGVLTLVVAAVTAIPQTALRSSVAVTGLVVTALVAATGRVGVKVATSGVTVGLTALGHPRRFVAATDVLHAELVEDLDPMVWGGWGARWVPHRGVSAVVVRRGEAVRVDLTGGRAVVVTIDGAAGAVEAIMRLCRRTESTNGEDAGRVAS